MTIKLIQTYNDSPLKEANKQIKWTLNSNKLHSEYNDVSTDKMCTDIKIKCSKCKPYLQITMEHDNLPCIMSFVGKNCIDNLKISLKYIDWLKCLTFIGSICGLFLTIKELLS